MPSIRLLNRQRKKRIDLQRLRIFTARALSAVLAEPRPAEPPGEISVIFVSDLRIAEIHRQYMSIDGPTDVITFHHGDIFISVETAERQAREFETSQEHELLLYIVHGLLHLCGLEDASEQGFQEMRKVQEKIMART
jgi:probable rRNA maturation factor